MPIDVTLPGGLTLALAPDLILIGGAMVLMLWSAWRPDSASHQRSVGIGALVVTVITTAAVIWFAVFVLLRVGFVALTLLTHGHPDHAEGAARFAELTGTKVRALDPALRLGDEGLGAGDVITTGGLELRVVSTPGHTADSLCFHLPADRAVLTGDTVLGRGTTVVAHPDGRLGDYLDSLRRLRSLSVDDGVHTVLPGHGPVLEDAQGAVEFYLTHRAMRLAQVETSVENGLRTPGEIVAHVYADVDRSLWPAAELSVRAQLDYLREHGLIV